jgi:hypothetical protein
MPQPGSTIGYDITHLVIPGLGYQVGVAAVHHAPTSAARGYGYPGFTALSTRLVAYGRLAAIRAPGVHVNVALFLGGAAQLAQIEHTRLYFFYPAVLAGGLATFSFDPVPSMRLVVRVPFRYDLRTDMALAAGAGLGLALEFPLLPTATLRRSGS